MRCTGILLLLAGLIAGPAVAAAGPLAWLGSPLSGAGEHHIADSVAWHARLMVLAWGVLLPAGALAARFFKVVWWQDWPRSLDHKAWWHAHRALQYSGIALMTLGVAFAVWGSAAGTSAPARWHTALGWGVAAAAWLQVFGGVARGSKGGPTDTALRGDHYDMTRWRVTFERLHKALGWAALAVSVVVIALGLKAADAPRWMALVLGLWWLLLAALFALLQRQGRCIDTYQAIWGPDDQHPGNRRAPIGWGIRRYTAATWNARFGAR
jgi:hypothetical protein